MDGLSSIISSIAPQAAAPAPLWQQLLTGGMFGAGELGNLLQENKQNSYQNSLLNLMNNPQALTNKVLQAEQPISNSLTQAVTNQVQAQMASRGLAQAPGIFATTESQALAPFQQQNYQTALQQVLASLGAPGQYSNLNQPASNLTPALSMFLRSFGTPGGQQQGSNVAPAAWTVPPQQYGNPGITAPTGTAGLVGVPPTGTGAGIDPSWFGGLS